MRWILTSVLILSALPVQAQENEAEKLFRAMENKIRSAKSLKVVAVSELKADDKGNTYRVDATALFEKGNKSRIEVRHANSSFLGDTLVIEVSDGKKMVRRHKITGPVSETSFSRPLPDPAPQGTPEKHNDILLAALARAGMRGESSATATSTNIALFGRRVNDIDKAMIVSDFKLGVKERVGTAETQVVEYVLTYDGTKKAVIKLWISTRTTLPVKRQIEYTDTKVANLENYTEFAINPEFDGKLFDLPN